MVRSQDFAGALIIDGLQVLDKQFTTPDSGDETGLRRVAKLSGDQPC